jgi:hypothetical protein
MTKPNQGIKQTANKEAIFDSQFSKQGEREPER